MQKDKQNPAKPRKTPRAAQGSRAEQPSPRTPPTSQLKLIPTISTAQPSTEPQIGHVPEISGHVRRNTQPDELHRVGTVRGNRFLITQALHNLLDNAIDFSPRGGRLLLGLKRDAGWLTWSVLDQGPGVPEYALGRIFERFYSLPRGDAQDRSSGLGLCLVQEVSALHGGRVTVENAFAPNPAPAEEPAVVTGCRATLRLPASDADR